MRIAWMVLALLVAGCASSPPPPVFPDITFMNREPIRLDVASIDVVNEYRPPLQAPNVEHRFPVPLGATAARWASDRLRAVGSAGSARFIVTDASVVEEALPRSKGLTGLLTTDQAARIKGRLAARLEVTQGGGLASGFAEASAERSQTIQEGITLAERDQIFYRFEEALARDLDQALEAVVRQKLAPFIR